MRLSALKILRPDLYREAVEILKKTDYVINEYSDIDSLHPYLYQQTQEQMRWQTYANGHLGLNTIDHAVKILIDHGFEVTLKHPSNE
jgi:hypothetical protein